MDSSYALFSGFVTKAILTVLTWKRPKHSACWRWRKTSGGFEKDYFSVALGKITHLLNKVYSLDDELHREMKAMTFK